MSYSSELLLLTGEFGVDEADYLPRAGLWADGSSRLRQAQAEAGAPALSVRMSEQDPVLQLRDSEDFHDATSDDEVDTPRRVHWPDDFSVNDSDTEQSSSDSTELDELDELGDPAQLEKPSSDDIPAETSSEGRQMRRRVNEDVH
ncbi:unnamed protein product [Peniophora sp. CBMAI 1063]|nr:unnamed protein product [Peniophora sp. CBMAI 1063]